MKPRVLVNTRPWEEKEMRYKLLGRSGPGVGTPWHHDVGEDWGGFTPE